MRRTAILGTGAYAPEKVLTNADLERMVETSDAWITERTGIKERRIAAPGELTSDMAVKAAVRALEMAHTRAEELDLIIIGTISPDMPMPSCAVMVQAKLGAKKAFAFDLAAACAGSLYGMSIADQYIRNGSVKRALVVGVEMLSRVVDWTDRNTCVLFGDAARRRTPTMASSASTSTPMVMLPASSPSPGEAACIRSRPRCWRRSCTRSR
jgi:3-oxoacyl-[acyl-carrier-protein] synthase-3